MEDQIARMRRVYFVTQCLDPSFDLRKVSVSVNNDPGNRGHGFASRRATFVYINQSCQA